MTNIVLGFPRGTDTVKNLPAMQETHVLIPGSGRSLGEENGNPLQYSYLENPKDRGAWLATALEVARILKLVHVPINYSCVKNHART